MKKFFNKIVLFLMSLFTNLDEWIHDHVQPSIETVQRLKDLLDNPVANLVTVLIPGDFDEKLRQFAIEYLTKALDVLHATSDIVNEPDWTAKIIKTLNYVKTLSPSMQKGFWLRLTSELAKVSAGKDSDNVRGHSIDLLVQTQYSKLIENKTAADLPSEIVVDGEVQKVPTENQ